MLRSGPPSWRTMLAGPFSSRPRSIPRRSAGMTSSLRKCRRPVRFGAVLDIDNHYTLGRAEYDPQVLAGLSMSQIASQLDDPASPVAMAIDESANALIAAIDQVLHLPAGRD